MAKATKPAKVKAANKIKPAGKVKKKPSAKLKPAKAGKKKAVLPLPGGLKVKAPNSPSAFERWKRGCWNRSAFHRQALMPQSLISFGKPWNSGALRVTSRLRIPRG